MTAATDWQTIGAIAGPVLALLSLAWQASERLRRPVFDHWYRLEPYSRMGPDRERFPMGWEVRGEVRVINPRPTALIVEEVEMQATTRRWMPWRYTSLDRRRDITQIGPVDENSFSLSHSDLRSPALLRLRVKLRGRRRWYAIAWSMQGEREFTEEGRRTPGRYGMSMTPNAEPYPSSEIDPSAFRTR